MAKKANTFSEEILHEAKIRGMKPEDYVRELADCEQAELRLAVIDKKKLDEMRHEPDPVAVSDVPEPVSV